MLEIAGGIILAFVLLIGVGWAIIGIGEALDWLACRTLPKEWPGGRQSQH